MAGSTIDKARLRPLSRWRAVVCSLRAQTRPIMKRQIQATFPAEEKAEYASSRRWLEAALVTDLEEHGRIPGCDVGGYASVDNKKSESSQ